MAIQNNMFNLFFVLQIMHTLTIKVLYRQLSNHWMIVLLNNSKLEKQCLEKTKLQMFKV
jgi:hypothetical protein